MNSATNQDFIERLTESIAERVALLVKEILSASSQARTVSKQLYTVKEAAAYLGRSDKSIRNLIARRLLPVIKKGKRVHLLRRDMDTWIEKDRL